MVGRNKDQSWKLPGQLMVVHRGKVGNDGRVYEFHCNQKFMYPGRSNRPGRKGGSQQRAPTLSVRSSFFSQSGKELADILLLVLSEDSTGIVQSKKRQRANPGQEVRFHTPKGIFGYILIIVCHVYSLHLIPRI